VWHAHKTDSDIYSIGPTYYIDAAYTPVAVRAYAEKAAVYEAVEYDIYDDGVSIFSDSSSDVMYATGGIKIQGDVVTSQKLDIGINSDDQADDFNNSVIEKGSWMSCRLTKDGAARNLTFILELTEVFDEE
jgi:hypothetical protein